MPVSKGFNFSLRVVILVVVGLIAALAIIALLGDGSEIMTEFANRSTESGGFLEDQ